MGVWLVTADVLAASRFVTSPLAETVNALGVLAARNPQPWDRDWLARHGQAFLDRIKTDPFSTALARGMQSGRWLPVDLSVPPRPGDVTFEQELAAVRTVPPSVAKFDLSQSAGGRLPDALDVSDPAGSFADLLQWTWDHAVRAEWPRRKRKYEADIVSRTTVLSQRGWAAAVREIAKDVRWVGDGRLQITVEDHPPLDLSHAELVFIPSSLQDGRVAWEYPARFAVIYPAAGMLAAPAAPTAPEPLRRLLGPTRAEILLLIGQPITTTQLSAVTGLALGTIGSHLRVLLDAGLAERHRSGAHVLYRATPTGQQLLGHPDPAVLASRPWRAADLASSGSGAGGSTPPSPQAGPALACCVLGRRLRPPLPAVPAEHDDDDERQGRQRRQQRRPACVLDEHRAARPARDEAEQADRGRGVGGSTSSGGQRLHQGGERAGHVRRRRVALDGPRRRALHAERQGGDD